MDTNVEYKTEVPIDNDETIIPPDDETIIPPDEDNNMTTNGDEKCADQRKALIDCEKGASQGGKRHRRRMTMKKMKKMSKRKMAKWCKSKKNRRTKAGRKMCKK